MATEAAWLDGNNMEKEETKKNKEKNERRALTLTGLLMEGAIIHPLPIVLTGTDMAPWECLRQSVLRLSAEAYQQRSTF